MGAERVRYGPAVRARGAVLALALGVAVSVSPPTALGAKAGAAGGKTDPELARLRDFLTGTDRTFATRRDAADVLIEKNNAETRAILVEVLAAPVPSKATLAVLDVLAARESAHEALIDPLFGLLRSDDEPTRRAAALALGAYQGNQKVLEGLRDLASTSTAGTGARLAAVQALSQVMDKRAMEALVGLTSDPQRTVADAAAAALADMTGIPDLPASAKAWNRWWEAHRNVPESELLARLLKRFRERLKRREEDLARVQARLISHLTEIYEAADAKERANLALGHLDDAVPQVRALAARQAGALAPGVLSIGNGTARQAYQELIAALLKHVGGPILLAQLDKEATPETRAAMAAALGNLKVVEAVPKLMAMLDALSEVEVLRAAGALGQIGEKNGVHAEAVKPALKPLSRLARTAAQPAVREAGCLALARIAPPSAEQILSAALDDPVPSVRFSAAQGLGNLGKADEKTVAALVARLQDKDKGVRQAVAAALAKVGGADAAAQMADRLMPGAEAEPAVRNALWEAIRSLADQSGSPDLAQQMGDVFFGREGAEDMQRAAALFELALTKVPATARNSPAAVALYEKLVDAYLAAGTPDSAVPTLRQLIILTPEENKTRLREINQQLGLILLAKEPYTEGIPPLVAAMDGADTPSRNTILKAVQARAEALLNAKRPELATELLTALARARPDWGGTDLAPALKALNDQAAAGAIDAALTKLTGSEEQAAAATATLKKIGKAAAPKLLDALEAAARKKQTALEARVLAALEAATARSDHGYDPKTPLDDRLKKIADWRKTS
ncbi:MAG: hypothetical protein AMK72_14880 [Planctomycetes bacterium SM23_25]|nr:MAG: hypothetical protein AMK72_14880 [Planctomycetes bacterium SM23_25]